MKALILTTAWAGALACLLATGADAAIINQSETFTGVDTDAEIPAGYVFAPNTVGPATQLSGADTSPNDKDDHGLDGANDGGIYLDGNPTGETVTYNFAGTIENLGVYTFNIQLYQASTSFANATVELLANNVQVAALATGGINGTSANANPSQGVTLVHIGTALTAGQTLGFRVTQTRAGNNNSADAGIDVWTLTSVEASIPEPGTMLMGMLGLCGLAVCRRRQGSGQLRKHSLS